MESIASKLNDMGYNLLNLDHLIFLSLDPNPSEDCKSCNKNSCTQACTAGCATCEPGCSQGPH